MSSDEEYTEASLEESGSGEEFSDDELAAIQETLNCQDEDEEDEFEGFPLQWLTEMNWMRTPFQKVTEDFSLQCGPTNEAPQQQSALQYFKLFFEDELI